MAEIEEIKKFIRGNNSGGKNNKSCNYGIKTNFLVPSLFGISENDFQHVYSEILSRISNHSNLYEADKQKHKDTNKDKFDATKYGLPFMERINEGMVPVVIDMLIVNEDRDSTELFDCSLRAQIVKIIQTVLLSVLTIPNEEVPKEFYCFVLKSEIWHQDDEEKQRLRFIFPGTRVNKSVLNTIIIPEIIKDLINHQVLRLFYNLPKNKWEEIIQPIGDYMTLYGCKEYEHEAPLFFDCVYIDSVSDDIDKNYCDEDDSKFTSTCLDLSIFPVFNGIYFQKNILEKEDCYTDDGNKYLTLILSPNYSLENSKLDKNITLLRAKEPPKEQRRKEAGFKHTFNEQENFDEISSMICPTRFKKSTIYYWYTYGKCCFNIFNGTSRGYEKFKAITPDELKPRLESYWHSLEKEFFDLRTLMEYARQDNYDQYYEWIKKITEPLVDYCISMKGADMPMSKLARFLFCLDYVYDRFEKQWYYKNKSVLERDMGALRLREDISDTMKDLFNDILIKRETDRDSCTGREEQKIHNARIKDVMKIVEGLEKAATIDKIIKSLEGKLFDDNFSKFKDENLNLMGCTNVVLEVYDDNICYREGIIQDYITKSTEIPFPTAYETVEKKVKFLKEYYSQVHTDPDMCHYFLKDMASFLVGGNEEKLFRNYIGERNASKSKVIELLQKALGSYCVDFPSETITIVKGKASGAPDPALEQAKGARVAIVSETSKSEPLDVCKIKKYTGNDRYWNRTLNKEGGSRALSFKLIHMSNVIAAVPGADKAYKCREVIHPFLSRWEHYPPATKEEQRRQRRFKIDPKFSEKIQRLGQAQLYLMYEYFPIYKREGITKLPKLVVEVTKRHHREIDPYYNFLKEINRHYDFPNRELEQKLRKKKSQEDEYESDYDDEIMEEGDEEQNVKNERRKKLHEYLDRSRKESVQTIFNYYTRWFNRFSPDTQFSITQDDFRREMEEPDRLGPSERGYWYGISIKKKNKEQK